MPRSKQYREVSKLPRTALTVQQYADSLGCHHSLIYHRIKRKIATYEIVVFRGINFVIP